MHFMNAFIEYDTNYGSILTEIKNHTKNYVNKIKE